MKADFFHISACANSLDLIGKVWYHHPTCATFSFPGMIQIFFSDHRDFPLLLCTRANPQQMERKYAAQKSC